MIVLLLLSPLLAGITPLLINFMNLRNGTSFSRCLVILYLFTGVIFSLISFFESSLLSVTSYCSLGSWVNLGLLQVGFDFSLDFLSASMVLIVLFVSFCVHTYATSYMYFDSSFGRFFVYLPVFTAFMLVLVLSNNLVLLFVGWEGVGIMSYLLVGFWYDNLSNNKCALKALNYNKIGDIAFLLAMILIYSFVKSFDCDIINSTVSVSVEYTVSIFGFYFNFLSVVGFFLFLAAMGKSSQIVLHVWLPDAMAGATPVSALLHAATMVTAGVYLVIRMSDIFSGLHSLSNFLIIVGSLTALLAASVGLVQNDLKKVIAYSTCSQLGYMIMACGCQQYLSSFYHLFNHAFFKALLFLAAGAVIHSLSDEQDMRKMGGLVYSMPISYVATVVGSLALSGFPFLTGYYSKDVLLELVLSNYEVYPIAGYCVGVLAAMFTAFYSARSIWYVFLSKYSGHRSNTASVHEPDNYMMIPVVVLTFCSMFVGYLTFDLYLGVGSLNSVGSLSSLNFVHFDAEHLRLYTRFIPLLFSLAGIFSCLVVYFILSHKSVQAGFVPLFSLLRSTFNNSWYINSLWNWLCGVVYKDIYDLFYILSDGLLLQVYGAMSAKSGLQSLYCKVRLIKLGNLGGNLYLLLFVYTSIFYLLFF
jgi:proton-translocating NADH-quinone oxidoreductase chain L